MTARFARPALLALALLVPATGAVARTHHHGATTHHTTAHHKTAKTAHDRRDHRKAKPAEHKTAAPGGATSVPGGGLKVFCPARKNPLLIRKATQGAGTTVTVVCR